MVTNLLGLLNRCAYNIFVNVNISSGSPHARALAPIFRLLAQPVRIQILLILAEQEACVCHIEAALEIRQAVISQHLMLLRKAGWITAKRDGRNIFYRLAKPELKEVIINACMLAGIPQAELMGITRRPLTNCRCPQCNPGANPRLACSL